LGGQRGGKGKGTGGQRHIPDNDNYRHKSPGNIHCLSVLHVTLWLGVILVTYIIRRIIDSLKINEFKKICQFVSDYKIKHNEY